MSLAESSSAALGETPTYSLNKSIQTLRLCRILREAEQRFRNEFLDDEERMLLLDRIKRLRKVLEA